MSGVVYGAAMARIISGRMAAPYAFLGLNEKNSHVPQNAFYKDTGPRRLHIDARRVRSLPWLRQPPRRGNAAPLGQVDFLNDYFTGSHQFLLLVHLRALICVPGGHWRFVGASFAPHAADKTTGGSAAHGSARP